MYFIFRMGVNFLRLGNPDGFEFRIYKDLFLKSISVEAGGGRAFSLSSKFNLYAFR